MESQNGRKDHANIVIQKMSVAFIVMGKTVPSAASYTFQKDDKPQNVQKVVAATVSASNS